MNVERMRARAETAQHQAAQREAAERLEALNRTPLGQFCTALAGVFNRAARDAFTPRQEPAP